jgi:hypothetical protein
MRLFKTLEDIVRRYVAKPLVIGGIIGILGFGRAVHANDVLVNTYTVNKQYGPDIAMNEENIIITWASLYQDLLTGIYAQRFDKEMSKVGEEFRVNPYTERGGFSQIAMAREGNFVITWSWGGSVPVKAQRFDKDGNRIGDEFIVNDSIGGIQEFPRIVMDSEGNFLIAFRYAGYGYIYAQRFDKDGNRIGEGFPLVGSESRIAMYPNGGFITTSTDGTREALYASKYDWNENLIYNVLVSLSKAGGLDSELGDSSVAISDNDFVIAWKDYDDLGSHSVGVYAQRFDREGNKVGDEFRVNYRTENDQRNPDVAMDPEGNFVIAWTGWNGSITTDVFAQRFDSKGRRVGDEFRVNSYIDGWQSSPRIGMSNNGDFVIAWWGAGEEDDQGIYAKKFPFYNQADLDHDGYVNFKDFAKFAENWLAYHP